MVNDCSEVDGMLAKLKCKAENKYSEYKQERAEAQAEKQQAKEEREAREVERQEQELAKNIAREEDEAVRKKKAVEQAEADAREEITKRNVKEAKKKAKQKILNPEKPKSRFQQFTEHASKIGKKLNQINPQTGSSTKKQGVHRGTRSSPVMNNPLNSITGGFGGGNSNPFNNAGSRKKVSNLGSMGGMGGNPFGTLGSPVRVKRQNSKKKVRKGKKPKKQAFNPLNFI